MAMFDYFFSLCFVLYVSLWEKQMFIGKHASFEMYNIADITTCYKTLIGYQEHFLTLEN